MINNTKSSKPSRTKAPYTYNEATTIAQTYIYVKPIKLRTMEVLTIEHSAFQQLISKLDAMDEFIRKAKLEQQSSLDDDWVDGQAVCEYLCICDKTLQRLRSAGKITYSTIGNKYYYQIAEIKRCLRAHTIKSSEEMLQNLIAHKRNSKAKASTNVQQTVERWLQIETISLQFCQFKNYS